MAANSCISFEMNWGPLSLTRMEEITWLQCSPELLFVLLLVFPEDQDIVNETKDSTEPIKYGANSLLEMFRRTGDSKGYLVEAVPPKWCDKGVEVLRCLCQWNLPEATVSI